MIQIIQRFSLFFPLTCLLISTGCENPDQKRVVIPKPTPTIVIAHQEKEVYGPEIPSSVVLEDPVDVEPTSPVVEGSSISSEPNIDEPVALEAPSVDDSTTVDTQPQPPADPVTIAKSSSGHSCQGKTYGGITHYKYPQYQGEMVEISGGRLRPQAANAFLRMKKAAGDQGIPLWIISSFRNEADQSYLFYEIAEQRRQSLAQRARVSAPPGHSEHHTGLTIDVNSLNESFANTAAYQWLQANAHKFGWELSFPQGNAQGVAFEPWHWRFIGIGGEFASEFCR